MQQTTKELTHNRRFSQDETIANPSPSNNEQISRVGFTARGSCSTRIGFTSSMILGRLWPLARWVSGHSLLRRVCTDQAFASRCSPPRLAATQLCSATGCRSHPDQDFHPVVSMRSRMGIPARPPRRPLALVVVERIGDFFSAFGYRSTLNVRLKPNLAAGFTFDSSFGS